MKKLRLLLTIIGGMVLATSLASAQSVDAYFGFNTLITQSGPSGIPKLGGGFYPSAGGDIIFLPYNLGIGGQVTWRATQANYFNQAVRPIYYDFNLVWEPSPTTAEVRPDFALGFGAESLRYYTGAYSCGTFTGCTDYVSSNHLALHAAVGVKIYVHGHIFLRPSVDFYNIRHNYEYGVPSAWQAGISIGYTIGPSS